MISSVHPAFILIFGALLVPFFKGKARNFYVLLLPLISVWNLMNIPEGYNFTVHFLGFDLLPARIDKLSMVFGLIFHIITFIGVLFALKSESIIQDVAALAYAGAAMGVTFAGDLLTLFLFWETLTITAATIIWSNRTKKSQQAGFRYMLVHIIGGLMLLAGIILRAKQTGSIAFDHIGLEQGLSSYLIFLGFGVNAAWPGLHAWLVDAYPEASWGGTVFLSAFTTKSAVYVLARGFAGTEVLIWIGVAMAAFPIFYAVIENDLRRVLSYSLINQVGFMMVGVGIGTELSINGTCAHAFAHILYKGLLFMSMGAVIYRTGKINATDLGGLYKSMPWTCLFCCIGAASISAFPLFSGFVSKSMIVSATEHGHMLIPWLVLVFASAGVFHHSGIKIPFFAFFGHDAGIRTKEAPWYMLIAMGIAAFLCVFIGVYPEPLYALLPYPTDYVPYTFPHVSAQLQLLFFSALAFTLLMLSGFYPPEIRSVNLDIDVFYRKPARLVYWVLDKSLNFINTLCNDLIAIKLTGIINSFFQSAPQRLAYAAMRPFWAITTVTPDKLKEKKKRLYAALETGSSPIGISAMVSACVFFFLVLYVLLLT